MRKSLTVAAVTVGALAIIVLVLVATPLGFRLAKSLAVKSVEDEAGLALSIGSLSGNLLSHVRLESVELSVPGGPVLLRLEDAEFRYDLSTLVLQRTFLARVELEGVSALLDIVEGEPVGWNETMRRAPSADTLAAVPALGFDVTFEAREVAVTFRDTAAGVSVLTSGLSARGRATSDSYDAALEGTLSVAAPGLCSPIEGVVAADLSGEGRSLELARLSFEADELALTVSGRVEATGEGSPPFLDLKLLSRVDIAVALALAGAGGEAASDGGAAAAAPGVAGPGAVPVGGLLTMRADITGSAESPTYRVSASSSSIDVGGVAVTEFEVRLAGGVDHVEVESFEADLLGGSVAATARVDVVGALTDKPTIAYEMRAEAAGLSLLRIAGLVPAEPEGESPELTGVLTASAVLSGEGTSMESIEGTFKGAVSGLTVDDRSLGDVSVEGSVSRGVLSVAASCCSTAVLAHGALSDDGIERLEFSVVCGDLSALGSVAGAPDLTGSLGATGTLEFSAGAPTARLDVTVPDGAYAGVPFGPADAHVEWTSAGTASEFSAFGGSVTGRAGITPDGVYEASFVLDELDLAPLVPDSIRDEWSFRGTVSGAASVIGDTSAVQVCEGEIAALALEARGHRVSLDTPFGFRASADSVSVSHVSLTSDLGWVSASGRLSSAQGGRIAARFRAVDVAGLSDFAPAGSTLPLAGLVDGTVSLEGNLRRPRFVTDLSVEGLSIAGIAFDSVVVSAASDTSDLTFDLVAASAESGTVVASGSVPLTASRAGLPVPDAGRDFGLSVICDGLAVDLGSYLLPGVRGVRRFSANGSVLLTGRSDSLGSMHGRGSFSGLSATFDLLRFAVSDTFEFEIDGGAVEIPPTTVRFTRRRVLGDKGGGDVTFHAGVGRDGSLEGAVSARGAQVARLLRTFAPRSGIPVRGELDVDAVLGGTLSEPVVDVAWEMEAPVVSGLAFGRAEGNARFSPGELLIRDAALRAGDHSVEVRGLVPLHGPREGSEPREFDLSVRADGFDLGAIRPAVREISRIGGRLSADLHVKGPMEAPVVEGEASLRDGVFEGYDLTRPARDVTLSVSAAEGTVVLNEASATFGNGAVRASGFVVAGPGEEPTFWLKTVLDSPEIGTRNAFDALLSGSVVWAGRTGRSQMAGSVVIEEATIRYEVGLLDVLQRRPVRVILKRPDDPAANTELDLELSVRDKMLIENNVADISLEGGLHLGGTFYSPSISGGFYSEEGRFKFLENEFDLESLGVAFIDPRRRDPHIDLSGVASVSDRADEEYTVTVRVQGFARDVIPELTSDPPLSEPDIVALLTLGETAGVLVGGGDAAGSSGDRFGSLARNAFLSSAFGVAESALERLLKLDKVMVDEEAILSGDAADADVTLGKEFGDRLRVNYTTAVGRLDEQQIEVALELAKYLALESRADPEGNHAIDLRLRIPFR